jgi:hypothetical protein
MSDTQFAILCLLLLFGFGLLDKSGCGCLLFIAAVVGLTVLVLL